MIWPRRSVTMNLGGGADSGGPNMAEERKTQPEDTKWPEKVRDEHMRETDKEDRVPTKDRYTFRDWASI